MTRTSAVAATAPSPAVPAKRTSPEFLLPTTTAVSEVEPSFWDRGGAASTIPVPWAMRPAPNRRFMVKLQATALLHWSPVTKPAE